MATYSIADSKKCLRSGHTPKARKNSARLTYYFTSSRQGMIGPGLAGATTTIVGGPQQGVEVDVRLVVGDGKPYSHFILLVKLGCVAAGWNQETDSSSIQRSKGGKGRSRALYTTHKPIREVEGKGRDDKKHSQLSLHRRSVSNHHECVAACCCCFCCLTSVPDQQTQTPSFRGRRPTTYIVYPKSVQYRRKKEKSAGDRTSQVRVGLL